MLKVSGAICLLVTAGAAHAVPVQWLSADGGNGHYYEIVEDALPWAEARRSALESRFEGLPGYLATITSEAEQGFLNTVNPGDTPLWIGANDFETEGVFVWADGPEAGEALIYDNFASAEPNQFMGREEDVVEAWRFGDAWNDFPAGDSRGYLVEYSALPGTGGGDGGVAPIPLPAGLGPLGAALGGLSLIAARRRR